MGKRTNAVTRTDATETTEPFDDHQSRAGIYDAPLDTADRAASEALDTTSPAADPAVTINDRTGGLAADGDLLSNEENTADLTTASPDLAATNTVVEKTTFPADTTPAPATDIVPIEDADMAARDDFDMAESDYDAITTNETADRAEGIDTVEEPEESPEVAAARARIEQTRAEMSETIDAIKEKLNPQHLMQEARDTARMKAEQMAHTAVETTKEVVSQAKEKVREVAPQIVRTVKRNPIPFVLGGVLVGWLLIRARSRRQTYCE
jgi:hypothetical protein